MVPLPFYKDGFCVKKPTKADMPLNKTPTQKKKLKSNKN